MPEGYHEWDLGEAPSQTQRDHFEPTTWWLSKTPLTTDYCAWHDKHGELKTKEYLKIKVKVSWNKTMGSVKAYVEYLELNSSKMCIRLPILATSNQTVS